MAANEPDWTLGQRLPVGLTRGGERKVPATAPHGGRGRIRRSRLGLASRRLVQG